MKKNHRYKVALVFDDGFPTSSRRVASIFEEYHLKAIFAVLSQPELFKLSCAQEFGGGWPLYKELHDRGHLIHPHGSDHQNLTSLELFKAFENIRNCFEAFQKNGFSISASGFHYPYNSGSTPLNQYLLNDVKWVRIGATGNEVWNTKKNIKERVLVCTAFGPDFCDQHLLTLLKSPIPKEAEVLIYNLHGIDGEGWGSIHESALREALEYILASPYLCYSSLDDLD